MRIGGQPQRPRRRLNLTPMIDVVLLLLVFFMMVSRFGGDLGLPMAVAAPSGGTAWQGPPRLVTVTGDGITLNGSAVTLVDLPARLAALMPAPDAPVVLRTGAGADVQALVAVMDGLRAAEISRLVLVD
jgi:biopolymer transport protein ExbD